VTRRVILFLCGVNGPVAGSGGAERSSQVRRKADLWPLESAGRAATSDRRQSQVDRHNETSIVAGRYCHTKIIKLPLAPSSFASILLENLQRTSLTGPLDAALPIFV
jgi:hypothetical protein